MWFACSIVAFAAAMWQGRMAEIAIAEPPQPPIDPAAWGDDHVGRPMPEFVSGDECLFCHRQDVGLTWSDNRHATTIRRADPEIIELFEKSLGPSARASDAELMMGRDNRIKLLKRLPAYGALAILSAGMKPPTDETPAEAVDVENVRWMDKTFAQSCAGCHASGVDARSGSFSAMSLDCFVCHGDATLDHSTDALLIHLSKKRRDDARVVASVCAQCHIRTGVSRSTGRPYPNNFVAGDNLFRDFQVDFSDEHLNTLNPADRHVLQNVRDVVVRGEQAMTCLSCHRVHGESGELHQRAARGRICLNCHESDRPKLEPKAYAVQSRVCDY